MFSLGNEKYFHRIMKNLMQNLILTIEYANNTFKLHYTELCNESMIEI